jgi:hypothetical protein
MSQENVEVVRRAVFALNERDIDGYLACCTEDVQLLPPAARSRVPTKAEAVFGAFSRMSRMLGRTSGCPSSVWRASIRIGCSAFSGPP